MAASIGYLLLLVLCVGAAAAQSCQSYDGLSSSPALWSALYGSSASIAGPVCLLSPVIFDLPSQTIHGGIVINSTGALYIRDRGVGQAASLSTDFISVQGLLQAGSASCPLHSTFTFQMQGGAEMPYLMHSSATPMLKAVVVWQGGSLELHGAKGLTAPNGAGVSWTRLQGTLPAGATTMTLADVVHSGSPHDWQIGDRVIISTTDYVNPTHPTHFPLLSMSSH